MKKIPLAAMCLLPFIGIAQIDVQHYRFEIELNDLSDSIFGKTTVRAQASTDDSKLVLDLEGGEGEKGMHVRQVTAPGGRQLNFTHSGNKLTIHPATPVRSNEQYEWTITYAGVPKDGLIISRNKYGERTFFADNWPNRAHHWIPVHDVPSDKASFEFIVTAPAQYQVISNGVKVEEVNKGDKTRTHWREDIPLSTKIMVIGAARFAVKNYSDSPQGINISAWVYPQDSSIGFYDYGIAPRIVKFFSDYIASFPYSKLANVQSKTIFGGMENAGAIFYSEGALTGKRSSEATVAHEIVHQWFGDMASEKSFAHLWLSEGFATYLTDIYYEQQYGTSSLKERLIREREIIINFVKHNNRPVVDTNSNLMQLLNANSYQKGSWILHMLRNEVGDDVFRQVIRSYYNMYKGSNADTRDFQAVAEKVSGKDLKWFFDQWLYRPGVPALSVKWKADGKKIKGSIKQTGDMPYVFPLELGIKTEDGKTLVQQLRISSALTEFKIDLPSKPVKLELDPNVLLLFREGR